MLVDDAVDAVLRRLRVRDPGIVLGKAQAGHRHDVAAQAAQAGQQLVRPDGVAVDGLRPRIVQHGHHPPRHRRVGRLARPRRQRKAVPAQAQLRDHARMAPLHVLALPGPGQHLLGPPQMPKCRCSFATAVATGASGTAATSRSPTARAAARSVWYKALKVSRVMSGSGELAGRDVPAITSRRGGFAPSGEAVARAARSLVAAPSAIQRPHSRRRRSARRTILAPSRRFFLFSFSFSRRR